MHFGNICHVGKIALRYHGIAAYKHKWSAVPAKSGPQSEIGTRRLDPQLQHKLGRSFDRLIESLFLLLSMQPPLEHP